MEAGESLMAGFCPSPYKDAYPSMGAARKVVKEMKVRSRRQKNKPLPQEPYKCNCGEYHLTHPKRRAAYDNAQHRRRHAEAY